MKSGHEFAHSSSVDALADIAVRHIGDRFNSQTLILLPDGSGELHARGTEPALSRLTVQEGGGRALDLRSRARRRAGGRRRCPATAGIYLPLLTPKGTIGVLGLYPSQPEPLFSPDQMHCWKRSPTRPRWAIERARLAEESERSQLQVETEWMRSALLSSVSHDLRTPLVAITGAASGMLQHKETLDARDRELTQIIYEEAGASTGWSAIWLE